ncbi:hypothetical protein BsWGS_23768 [Bradybaena similaris]
MMLSVFTVILALVTACAGCLCKAPFAAASTRCREGWIYFAGSCYSFPEVPRNWHQAAASCISHGAYLAEIESEEENNWLVNRINTTNFGSVWIGGTEVMKRGTILWAYSGNPLTFSDWSPGQPSDPGQTLEDCVEIRQQFGYKWNDWQCDTVVNRYVCETRPL